jgi:uncharacterized protein (TIGR01777 family)
VRVFLTGASGLIGGRLARELVTDSHQVVAVSRTDRAGAGTPGVEWLTGDVNREGAWCDAVTDCDAVVHLAGESVASGRWTAVRKRRLVASRVDSTRLLVAATQRDGASPRILVCASACGFYGGRGDEALIETSPPGSDFLARLCVDWEAAAQQASSTAIRVVSLRFGVVLSRDGGALARMLTPFKLGLGGPLGPPERWFPWVHEDDAVGLTRFALEHSVEGPVNVTAPGSVRMRDFASSLGRVLKRPAVLPLPEFAMKLALGEMGASLTPGQRVVPQVALESGYAFQQPELEPALRALL